MQLIIQNSSSTRLEMTKDKYFFIVLPINICVIGEKMDKASASLLLVLEKYLYVDLSFTFYYNIFLKP